MALSVSLSLGQCTFGSPNSKMPIQSAVRGCSGKAKTKEMGEKAKENDSENTEIKKILNMPSIAAPKDDEDLGKIFAAIEAKKKLSKGRGAQRSKEVNIDDRNPFLKKAVKQGKNEDDEDRGEILTNAGAKKKVATGLKELDPIPGIPFLFQPPPFGMVKQQQETKKMAVFGKICKDGVRYRWRVEEDDDGHEREEEENGLEQAQGCDSVLELIVHGQMKMLELEKNSNDKYYEENGYMKAKIKALEEELKENWELKEKVGELEELQRENGQLKEKVRVYEEQHKEHGELKEKIRLFESQAEENMEFKNKSKAFVDLLEERVKCPVCLEVPTSSPMYSCSNGHLVCVSCYQGSNSDCSMCRTKMFKNVSLLAKTVLENIEHRCRFDIEGCKVRTPLAEVEGHKKICNFRPVSCPSYRCKDKVAFEKVIDHILSKCKHSFSMKYLEGPSHSQVFNVPISSFEKYSTKVQPMKFHEHFFFLNEKIDNEHVRRFYVQMLGTPEECKKHTVEIKLADKTGKQVNTFRDHPLPIEMSEEESKFGGMQISNSFKRKICTPVVGNPEKLAFSVELTFASVSE